MQSPLGLLFTAALVRTISAQFISPPLDLTSTEACGVPVRYKEVPSGICETVEGVKSYSGFLDVGLDQHLFFWFIEARNQDPSTAPLTLWLNGGPGDPSSVGLFSENGPCWVDYEGNVQFNKYSWNNVSNMLYLDQPTGTGFSYSIPVNAFTNTSGVAVAINGSVCPDIAPPDTCGTISSTDISLTQNSTVAAAPNVWRALQGFTGAFPQYAQNGVHISTESYGGHYGPVFADYIEQQNAKSTNDVCDIDLRGLTVGNGWFDPIIQFQAYYNFTVNPGNTYDFVAYNKSTEEKLYDLLYAEGNCMDQLYNCNFVNGTDEVCMNTDDFCYEKVEYLYDEVTLRDEYDLRELMPDPFPYTHWVKYLNSEKVQKAVGAFTNFTYTVTNLGAGPVAAAFASTGDDSRSFDIIAKNRRLVNEGVYVLHYAGDADYCCNWLGGEEVARQIDAPGWTEAGYENITTSDGIVHGVSKQAGKYSFVRIYDSGHQVPFYQPLVSLEIFERMLKQTDIATGQQDVSDEKSCYRSQGPAKSEYRNGNSTIQMEVIGEECTYNIDTNVPECP